MKPKTLFLTWMVCQLAVSVYAERQKPMVTNYPVETIEIDGKSEYYMYNTGAKKFWTGANLWGTQASVGPIGWKVRFSQHVSVKDKAWDGKTVLLEDFAMNRTWLKAWIVADANIIYTDYYGQADYFWCIQKVGDAYRLSASALNPNPTVAGYANKYVGIDATKEDSVLYSDLTESETNHIDWIFFNATAYDAALDLYEDAQFLLKRITEAEKKGLDVTAQKQVYDNNEATAEEVSSAIAAVNIAISEYEEKNVSPNAPVDKTSLIVNPNYDNNDNEGWSGTTPLFQTYTNAEHYNKTFDSWQVLENIPNGVYKLTVQGFYRPSNSNRWNYENGEAPQYAVFYASNGADSLISPVPNIHCDTDDSDILPNNMQQTGEAFAAGKYVTTLHFVVSDHRVRIGIAQNEKAGDSDWVIWDNWQLTYYGNKGEASFNSAVKEMIDANLTRFDAVTEKMSIGIVDTYKATISKLTATDLASVNKAKQTIESAIDAVEENLSAWKKYLEPMEEWNELFQNDYVQIHHWNKALRNLDDYLKKEAIAFIKEQDATTAELQEETEKLKALINATFVTKDFSLVNAVWSYVHFDRTHVTETGDVKEINNYIRYTVLDKPENIDRMTYYPLVKYTTCEYEEGKEVATYRIRMEENRVYILKEDAPESFGEMGILKEEGKDYILYDFNLKEGDEFCKLENGNSVNMSDSSSVTTIDGKEFNTLNVMNNHWIEGIGSIYDFLTPLPYAEVDCDCGFVLNYFKNQIYGEIVVYKNPLGDITSVSTAFKADDCASGADAIKQIIKEQESAQVHPIGQTLLCTSPTATKLEVYTMDAIKVDEAAFANGEATVKVKKTPATYLYIVTYPDGRRESGKVMVKIKN